MGEYQRSIHSQVWETVVDRLTVSSSLLDLEHSFHLEMTVETDGWTIESAVATMSKAPLSPCRTGAAVVSRLGGLQVKRGVVKELHAGSAG